MRCVSRTTPSCAAVISIVMLVCHTGEITGEICTLLAINAAAFDANFTMVAPHPTSNTRRRLRRGRRLGRRGSWRRRRTLRGRLC